MLQSSKTARTGRKADVVERPFVLSMNARQSLESRRIAPDRFLRALVRARKKIVLSETGHLLVLIGDLWAVAKDNGAAFEVLIVMNDRDVRATLALFDAKPNAA